MGGGGKPKKVSCDVTFLRRFFRLLRLINAWPALILVVLSLGKSLLSAQGMCHAPRASNSLYVREWLMLDVQ